MIRENKIPCTEKIFLQKVKTERGLSDFMYQEIVLFYLEVTPAQFPR